MGIFKPKMYKKSIFDIDYNHLKELGITCLVFDLDNTLGLMEHKKCPQKVKQLIVKLKEDFLVLICSNNMRRRIRPYLEDLGVGGISWSMKPSTYALNKIKRNYRLTKKEMCLIGDQIVTDIVAGNRFHITTILVDPMGKKELKITGINRKLEDKIIRMYQKKGVFERGKYYE